MEERYSCAPARHGPRHSPSWDPDIPWQIQVGSKLISAWLFRVGIELPQGALWICAGYLQTLLGLNCCKTGTMSRWREKVPFFEWKVLRRYVLEMDRQSTFHSKKGTLFNPARHRWFLVAFRLSGSCFGLGWVSNGLAAASWSQTEASLTHLKSQVLASDWLYVGPYIAAMSRQRIPFVGRKGTPARQRDMVRDIVDPWFFKDLQNILIYDLDYRV